jgi:hypothetical protein
MIRMFRLPVNIYTNSVFRITFSFKSYYETLLVMDMELNPDSWTGESHSTLF